MSAASSVAPFWKARCGHAWAGFAPPCSRAPPKARSFLPGLYSPAPMCRPHMAGAVAGTAEAHAERPVAKAGAAHGGSIQAHICDVREAEQIEAIVDAIWQDGPLTGLINNAAANSSARAALQSWASSPAKTGPKPRAWCAAAPSSKNPSAARAEVPGAGAPWPAQPYWRFVAFGLVFTTPNTTRMLRACDSCCHFPMREPATAARSPCLAARLCEAPQRQRLCVFSFFQH